MNSMLELGKIYIFWIQDQGSYISRLKAIHEGYFELGGGINVPLTASIGNLGFYGAYDLFCKENEKHIRQNSESFFLNSASLAGIFSWEWQDRMPSVPYMSVEK